MSGWRWGLGVLVVGTAVSLTISLPTPWPQMAACLLLFVWPTLTWGLVLAVSWPERWLLAAALAPLLNVWLALWLYYLPGAMPQFGQLLWHTLVALLPLFLPRRGDAAGGEEDEADAQGQRGEGEDGAGWWTWGRWAMGGVLLLALALRLTNLAYSEFQGDEGVIMVRAAAMITGDEAELFLHQKGPLEILLPLMVWQLAGQLNEFWARVPFTWASGWAVVAVFVLARRWFGWRVGLLAALFWALNGFAVAFGRIVQYQSYVMLWGVTAVLWATRYVRRGEGRDLVGTAVFLAGGLLAHYDAILVAPAVGWLLGQRLWQTRQIVWRHWAVAIGLAAGTLGLFYIPFLLNPNFARTGQYLLQGRLGATAETGPWHWSGPQVWQMITFYNSLYYVLGLALLLLVGLVVTLRSGYGRAAQGTAARGERGALWLFFFVPLLFYLFLVADPRTHVYTFFPGAAVLAAVGAVSLWQWLAGSGGWRWVLGGGLALFVGVTAVYLWLIFVDHTPERQRTWAENRPRFYPTTWEQPPLYGLFGFPHQAGWRLAAQAVTALPYASNEEREITDWYMAQAPRTHCANLASFVQAARVQDELPLTFTRDGLSVQARVMGADGEGLVVYGRSPLTTPTVYPQTAVSLWRTPAQVAPPTYAGAYPVGITLGENQVRLLGYDVAAETAVPGGQVVVTLYWQALAPFAANYQVFTHLYDGHMWAQHDGAPECGLNPTTGWEAGEIIADPHILALPPDIPDKAIPLLVGMYGLVDGRRLTNPTGADALHLTDIRPLFHNP